jgi:hypothetical protein
MALQQRQTAPRLEIKPSRIVPRVVLSLSLSLSPVRSDRYLLYDCMHSSALASCIYPVLFVFLFFTLRVVLMPNLSLFNLLIPAFSLSFSLSLSSSPRK